MKNRIRDILSLLLLAVFLISGGLWLFHDRSIARGADSYDRALELAGMPMSGESVQSPEAEGKWVPAPVEGDGNMERLRKINLAALQEENPDVLGWIMIPGTAVDYPIVQGEDNEFYLNHTWDGEQSGLGSIFLESKNSPELDDYNSIIYGHNIRDGSMFSVLKLYDEGDYLEEHPYVYILSGTGAWRYEVFAAYRAPVRSKSYLVGFTGQDSRDEFLDYALEKSVVESGVQPGEKDRILTLSTCTGGSYSHRWVVQARLEMVKAE